jgi:hypothetical protein
VTTLIKISLSETKEGMKEFKNNLRKYKMKQKIAEFYKFNIKASIHVHVILN